MISKQNQTEIPVNAALTTNQQSAPATGGRLHQGVERQWHDRRIGEHLRVVDIHTADELEYLGPPTDEGALAIFGFLDVAERRSD